MFAILALFIVSVWSEKRRLHELEYTSMFKDFVQVHSKNYTVLETADRYETFKANVDKINDHNAQNRSWTMALNRFADMSPLEFTAFVKRGNGGGFVHAKKEKTSTYKAEVVSCASSDLVTAGLVTDVKNQGSCGSCWSFSTTGAIEGLLGKNPTPLSEQELVDCDSKDSACNGGLMDYAFEYVEKNGLCSEADYAYKAKKQLFCHKSSCTAVEGSKITGYKDITAGDGTSMAARLCTNPVSVAIEADQNAFQFYAGGVMDGDCGENLDHGVLAVGFGTDNGKAYWKIKNSWGASWGESGYIRICKDCGKNSGKGQCGVLAAASYPTN